MSATAGGVAGVLATMRKAELKATNPLNAAAMREAIRTVEALIVKARQLSADLEHSIVITAFNDPEAVPSEAHPIRVSLRELDAALAAIESAAPAGDGEYEARYATKERLAMPPATAKCDFCGVRPGEYHAYDCTALDATPAGGGEVPARIEWLADRVQKWLDNLDGDTQTPGGSMCEAVDILADHGESIVAAIRAPQGTPAGGGGEDREFLAELAEALDAHADRDSILATIDSLKDMARTSRLASTGSAHGIPWWELAREAADVLEAVGTSGVPLPDNWRWPLADELSGAAALASRTGSAPAPSGVPEVSRAIPSQECYSPDQGDSWYDSPEDADILDTFEADHVGATFTLQVSHYAVERTYRVTKVPGDDSDDYEIEEVPATPTQEQQG